MPSTRRTSLPATLRTCLAFIVDCKRRSAGIHEAYVALLTDLRTIFFREVEIAEWTMKIHTRSQHVWIDNENFPARWTGDFNGLTHRLPRKHFQIFGFPDSNSTIICPWFLCPIS